MFFYICAHLECLLLMHLGTVIPTFTVTMTIKGCRREQAPGSCFAQNRVLTKYWVVSGECINTDSPSSGMHQATAGSLLGGLCPQADPQGRSICISFALNMTVGVTVCAKYMSNE